MSVIEDEDEYPPWRCQVQFVLTRETEGINDASIARALISKLGKDIKFLFDSDKSRKYGFDPDWKFTTWYHWEYEYIDVQEPEYTPSTHSITFNFMISVYPFPKAIIEMLQDAGWTVTGRYRMGVKTRTTQEIEWETWDYRLDEVWKRAAWTTEFEQINKDTANVDGEIRDCQGILAITSVSPPAPATPEEEKLLLSQTLNFRKRTRGNIGRM